MVTTCLASQLAWAWVLTQGEDMAPTPGTTEIAHLEEDLQAIKLTLTPGDLARLNEISPKGVAAGERYPEMGMKAVNG